VIADTRRFDAIIVLKILMKLTLGIRTMQRSKIALFEMTDVYMESANVQMLTAGAVLDEIFGNNAARDQIDTPMAPSDEHRRREN